MAEKTLHDAFIDEIRDIYDAERQITKALPRIVKAATSDELRESLAAHLEETKGQVGRLESVFELLDERVRGKHCAGMAGILEEGKDILEEDFAPATLDACLIAACQRVEHYEITAYGTVVAWAEALGLDEVAALLQESLDEETAADRTLSAIAEAGINAAATSGTDEAEEATRPSNRRK